MNVRKGLELAERNVLPVLNNLLENRSTLHLSISILLRLFILVVKSCSIKSKPNKRFLRREMQLEDGRFLMSASRYDTLQVFRPRGIFAHLFSRYIERQAVIAAISSCASPLSGHRTQVPKTLLLFE
jgi:hypothetical protein